MNFIEHLKKINAILKTSATLADDYNNPSGIGDFRELGISEILKSKLPSNLIISKGEIMDSTNKRTPEFDIVITYQSETPKYFSLGDRQVLPCEDVLMVGEVKSNLSKDNLEVFINGINTLNNLERYYQPTQIYKKLATSEAQSFINKGIKCNDAHLGVGRVGTFFFCYKSLSDETIISHLNNLNTPNNFLGVFSLGQSQIIKKNGTWTASPTSQKDDVLFWLLFTLIQYCRSGERHINLNSDVDRYFEKFVEVEAARLISKTT